MQFRSARISGFIGDPVQHMADMLTPRFMRQVVTPVTDLSRPPEDFKEGRYLIFIGGGRGSGKTALKHHVLNTLAEEGHSREYVAVMGSNVLEEMLPSALRQQARPLVDLISHKIGHGGAEGKSMIGRGAREIFRRVRLQVMEQGSPLIIDNHMDNPAFVERMVNEAQQHGYSTIFTAPLVEPEVAVERITRRAQQTGRKTDIPTALATHEKFFAALPHYPLMFDTGIMLDNNAHGFAPSLVAMSRGGEIDVFDREKYDRLQQKIREKAGTALGETAGNAGPAQPDAVAAGDRAGAAGRDAHGFVGKLMGSFSPGQSRSR